MTVITARPTTYEGIEMRSRLEARFAAFLDDVGFGWEYEPRAYADRSGQYLPDFVIDGEIFIDVKGRADDPVPLLDRMQPIWATTPGAVLVLVIADWFDRSINGCPAAYLEDPTRWGWRSNDSPRGVVNYLDVGFALCEACGRVSIGRHPNGPVAGDCGHAHPAIGYSTNRTWIDPFRWRAA